MRWVVDELGQLLGHRFLVTGANSGIGLEVARELVRRGAHVTLAVRDLAKGEQAAASFVGPGSTSVVAVDLSDLDQVTACATRVLDRNETLSAAICNAGVMGGPRFLSAQGFEGQMATNHLGHAALVVAIWRLLHASAARVVLVTSGEARGGQLSRRTTRHDLLNPTPYDARQVYRNSKQANLLFAQELHRRCITSGSPVSVVAAHPGAAATNLLARQLARAGHGLLGTVSTAATTVLLPKAAAGAQSTLRALDPRTPSGSLVGPARWGGFRGPPELLDIYPTARDRATAARLWQLTEEVLGTPGTGPAANGPQAPASG